MSLDDRMVRVTHYERDPVNGPGQLVTRAYNLQGNPFVVFCTNKDCPHYIEAEGAFPFWSEDCSEYLGVLRCRHCREPVCRPRNNW